MKAALIAKDLEPRFHEASFMAVLFCIFDVILFSPVPSSSGIRETNDKITNIFQDIRRIGAESVEGFALMSSFKQFDDMFVIKVPRNPENDRLFHEYFIGISCTNELRNIIPNYAYILGAFKCMPPTIGTDKRVN